MSMDNLDQLYEQHLMTVRHRTDLALAATGFDTLVIHSGIAPLQFLDDQRYPFKVNPHFNAWLPINDNPRCILIYNSGHKPTLLFYQPDDYWHKTAALPQASWTDHIQVIPLRDTKQASPHWSTLGRVAVIGAEHTFDEPHGTLNPPNLLTRLHFGRAIKTPYEIECMRRASTLGAQGHRAALAAFRRRASEYIAHMEYLLACNQREEEMPYNNIVAYNQHAAVLHYQHLARNAPTTFSSFLIDAGAQYRGYAADITRTYAARPGAFADLITGLDNVQLKLCSEVTSGKDYRDIHLSAHRQLGDLMHDSGLIKIPGQAALEQGVTSVFFPHGIGHLLGLQVHDVGGVLADVDGKEHQRPKGHPFLRLTRMLEPGVVVTIEPGIYWIDSLLASARTDARGEQINWKMVDELRCYGGIRIEDNVVVTTSVPENLTRDAFSKLAA